MSNVYLSVPVDSRRRDYSGGSVMLELSLADNTASKLSVEGTLVDGLPQWVAVGGAQLCRPVRLGGHLLVCRAVAGCACTSEQMDALRRTFKHVVKKNSALAC